MSRNLSLWIPTESSRSLYETLIRKFCQRHPNVNVQITDYPLCIYWKKLMAALLHEEGPDLYFMHNEYAKKFIAHGWMLPYNFSTQQKKILNECYPESCNQTYYYDFAYVTSLLYIQKEIKIQGNSWNTCFELLRQQSIFPFDFGCTVNLDAAAAFYTMISLQQKEYGAVKQTATEQWLRDMFRKLRVYDMNTDCKEAFLSKKIAMVYSWGWFAGYLNDAHMEYKVVPLCCEPHSGWFDRNNTKSSCGINALSKNHGLAMQFVFDFLSDIEMQKLFCLTRKVIPIHKKLQYDTDIKSDPVIKAQMEILPYTIFPEVPQSSEAITMDLKKIQKIYSSYAIGKKENEKDEPNLTRGCKKIR